MIRYRQRRQQLFPSHVTRVVVAAVISFCCYTSRCIHSSTGIDVIIIPVVSAFHTSFLLRPPMVVELLVPVVRTSNHMFQSSAASSSSSSFTLLQRRQRQRRRSSLDFITLLRGGDIRVTRLKTTTAVVSVGKGGAVTGSSDEKNDSTQRSSEPNPLPNNNSNINDSNNYRKIQLIREMIAEMTGTLIIVQLGTASIMSSIFGMATATGGGGSSVLFPIAVVWSIAVTIAITCTSSISGAHLNPAITIALSIFRSFDRMKVIPYIISQFIGAMLASCINLLIYGKQIVTYEVTNRIIRSSTNAVPSGKAFGEYYLGISTFQAFVVELFGTFLLSLVIFSLTHPSHKEEKEEQQSSSSSTTTTTPSRSISIPPLIGCTVGALIYTLAPLTQAGFNPARDFGPRIIAYMAGWKSVAFGISPNYYSTCIVYIVGPILGAILGAAYSDLVLFRPLGEKEP